MAEEKRSKYNDASEKRKVVVDRRDPEQIRKNQLIPGTLIRSHNKNSFQVLHTLGFGGFGDVYAVKETHTGKTYALKTEENTSGKESRLKVEVLVFQRIDEAERVDPRKTSHFIQMFDRGMNDSFKFVVMDYTGPNLEDLRTRHLGKDFRPGNFVVGRSRTTRSIVYLIDFGISLRINDPKAENNTKKYRFIGTVRYASRTCHEGKGHTPKDDLESWIFMAVEFFDRLALPWRRCTEHVKVSLMKKAFFKHKHPECYAICPAEMRLLVDHLEHSEGGQRVVPPDFFLRTLRELLVAKKIRMADDYDWTDLDFTAQEEAARVKATGSKEAADLASPRPSSDNQEDSSRNKGRSKMQPPKENENISASFKARKAARPPKNKITASSQSGVMSEKHSKRPSPVRRPSEKEHKQRGDRGS
ncbi:Protein kinase domain containing protein [Aphelenchoides avenae]|nr:Protein kinase domain containing protein [Aphelenchus avenae]